MADQLYDKYFHPVPPGRGGFFPILVANGAEHFDGSEFSIRIHYIAEDGVLIRDPHSHDFDQYYCFLGADMANSQDFRAQVELSLGKENEKHIITSPAIVHVPKDMIHGPLAFSNVKKPIIFVDALSSAQYKIKA